MGDVDRRGFHASARAAWARGPRCVCVAVPSGDDGTRARHRRGRPRPRVHADASDVRGRSARPPRRGLRSPHRSDGTLRRRFRRTRPRERRIALRRPCRRRRLCGLAAPASCGARRSRGRRRQARIGREADGDHAGGSPRDDRRRGARGHVADRRPQPQLRSSHTPHARDHRERRRRRRQDDRRAVSHRLSVSVAPARGARPRAGRRRDPEPGCASGRHRPAPCRRPGDFRSCAGGAMGYGAPDRWRLRRAHQLRRRRLRLARLRRLRALRRRRVLRRRDRAWRPARSGPVRRGTPADRGAHRCARGGRRESRAELWRQRGRAFRRRKAADTSTSDSFSYRASEAISDRCRVA